MSINSAFIPGFSAILGNQYALNKLESFNESTGLLSTSLNGEEVQFRYPKMDIGEMLVNRPLVAYAEEGEKINDILTRTMGFHEAGLLSGIDFDFEDQVVNFYGGISSYLTVPILSGSPLYIGSFGVTICNRARSPLSTLPARDYRAAMFDYDNLDWMVYLSGKVFKVDDDVELNDTIPDTWRASLWALLYAMDNAFNIDNTLSIIIGSEVVEKSQDAISSLLMLDTSVGLLTLRYTYTNSVQITDVTDFKLPGDPLITDVLLP